MICVNAQHEINGWNSLPYIFQLLAELQLYDISEENVLSADAINWNMSLICDSYNYDPFCDGT